MSWFAIDHADVGLESITAACAIVSEGCKRSARTLAMGTPAKVMRAPNDGEVVQIRKDRSILQPAAQTRLNVVVRGGTAITCWVGL